MGFQKVFSVLYKLINLFLYNLYIYVCITENSLFCMYVSLVCIGDINFIITYDCIAK